MVWLERCEWAGWRGQFWEESRACLALGTGLGSEFYPECDGRSLMGSKYAADVM